MLNDYYQNIGMKGFIQRYGVVNAVKRGAFMFIKLHLVKDYEVRKVLWQERASTKIKPYLKYKDTDVQGLSFPKNDVENPIWIYWNKGIEQAPIIVQKCYESVCKHSNQKIILLNDQNLADYIRLPEYIEKKKDAGQIPMAGYADLMKLISRVSGEKWARRVPVELPVYLFSGSCDPVGGMGKGVREVTGLLQQSGLQHLKMKLYPEGRHEMLKELCRQEVYADILEWLGRRKKV